MLTNNLTINRIIKPFDVSARTSDDVVGCNDFFKIADLSLTKKRNHSFIIDNIHYGCIGEVEDIADPYIDYSTGCYYSSFVAVYGDNRNNGNAYQHLYPYGVMKNEDNPYLITNAIARDKFLLIAVRPTTIVNSTINDVVAILYAFDDETEKYTAIHDIRTEQRNLVGLCDTGQTLALFVDVSDSIIKVAAAVGFPSKNNYTENECVEYCRLTFDDNEKTVSNVFTKKYTPSSFISHEDVYRDDDDNIVRFNMYGAVISVSYDNISIGIGDVIFELIGVPGSGAYKHSTSCVVIYNVSDGHFKVCAQNIDTWYNTAINRENDSYLGSRACSFHNSGEFLSVVNTSSITYTTIDGTDKTRRGIDFHKLSDITTYTGTKDNDGFINMPLSLTNDDGTSIPGSYGYSSMFIGNILVVSSLNSELLGTDKYGRVYFYYVSKYESSDKINLIFLIAIDFSTIGDESFSSFGKNLSSNGAILGISVEIGDMESLVYIDIECLFKEYSIKYTR
jgi:hypothetical protein